MARYLFSLVPADFVQLFNFRSFAFFFGLRGRKVGQLATPVCAGSHGALQAAALPAGGQQPCLRPSGDAAAVVAGRLHSVS